MTWGDKRHIPSAEDIAHMQQARKEAIGMLNTKHAPLLLIWSNHGR